MTPNRYTTITENRELAALTGNGPAPACVWSTVNAGYTVRLWDVDKHGMHCVTDERKAKSYAHGQQIARKMKTAA